MLFTARSCARLSADRSVLGNEELINVEQLELLAGGGLELTTNEILMDESDEWEGKRLTIEQRRERLIALR